MASVPTYLATWATHNRANKEKVSEVDSSRKEDLQGTQSRHSWCHLLQRFQTSLSPRFPLDRSSWASFFSCITPSSPLVCMLSSQEIYTQLVHETIQWNLSNQDIFKLLVLQKRMFKHLDIAMLGEVPELLKGLNTYSDSYPCIKSMVYNPLNAAIAVKVYKNSWKEESAFPKTLTDLYCSLIHSLLLRYLKNHSKYGKRRWKKLRQFSNIPPDVYQQFCEVSKLA